MAEQRTPRGTYSCVHGELEVPCRSGCHADQVVEEHVRERRARVAELGAAWLLRVEEVLRLHIGLIDPLLCEQTARFLAGEDWLIKGKPPLDNRLVLLIAKAVAAEQYAMVYAATSGEYDDDWCIHHLFTRQADAEAYEGGDAVHVYPLQYAPVEMRDWFELHWNPARPDERHRPADTMRNGNPWWYTERRDFTGADPAWVSDKWLPNGLLEVTGWDRDRVRARYRKIRKAKIGEGGDG
jgi:hypothetical protein